MRVCIVQPVIPHYRTALFNALGGCGDVDLTVWAGLTATGSPDTDERSHFDGFSFEAAKMWRLGPIMSQPRQLLAFKQGFDVIVYSWNIRYAELVPALLLTRHTGTGTVLWGHGTSPGEKRMQRRARDRVGRLADAVVVYSESVAQSMRSRVGAPVHLFSAPNTIALDKVRAARLDWLNQPLRLQAFRDSEGIAGSGLFLFMSRLLPVKRPELLLRAASSLIAAGRDVRVAFIGEGPARPSLETEARELGIDDRVHFVGAQYDEQEIAPWCASAVACVVPSWIGLTVMHAFGYGLPVVTSDEGAPPEFDALRDGANGILVRPGDASSLADAMRLLLENRERQAAMGAEALRTVEEGPFTFDRMVSGMRSAIDFAAQSRRRNSR